MGTGELNARGNSGTGVATRGLTASQPGGSRNTPYRLTLLKPEKCQAGGQLAPMHADFTLPDCHATVRT